jgi:lambda family phage portal protein
MQRKRSSVKAFFGRGGYEGARTDLRELMAWTPALGSADQDTLPDLPALRARTRDAERNQPLAAGALLTNVDNIVGWGLTPSAQIDATYLGLTDDEATAWEREAERIVEAVTETASFDVAGRNNFRQMQRLALRSVFSGGDALAVRRWRPRPGDVLALKVQLLEADRIANPSGRSNSADLREGVALDAYGCATGYWVASRHPSESLMGGAATYEFVPALGAESGMPMALLIMEQLRPGQTRGVPLLAPVLRQLKQLDRFTDSELAAAVIASFFTVFIESTPGAVDDDRTIADLEDADTADLFAGNNAKLGQGAVVELPDGKKISTANPGRPNAQFEPFVNAVATYMGVGLGVPKELLLKAFNSSYSASRAALLEAWRMFGAKQDWLVESFCQPVYNWIISEAVDRGLLIAPGFADDPMIRRAYLGTMWTGPTVNQLDPLKEVNAAIRRIEAGLSSRQIEAAQLTGQNWERVHRQLVKERNARVRDGLEPKELISSGQGSMITANDNETPPVELDGNADDDAAENTEVDDTTADDTAREIANAA